MDLKGKKAAILGDSITQGAGASSYEKCFVSVFEKIYGLEKVFNYGIGGTRISRQLKPSKEPVWDKYFIPRVDEMENDVDLVAVFGGTNDFGHGDMPFGEFKDTDENSFCGSCYVLMKKLAEKYAGKPIIVMTPLHRLGEDSLINEIGIKRHPLRDYVKVIKDTAEIFSLPVLDLFAASNMQPRIEAQNTLYFADGLHPNDKGHERVARLLGEYLKNIVE